MYKTEIKVSRKHYNIANVWRNVSLKFDVLVGWWASKTWDNPVPYDRPTGRFFLGALWSVFRMKLNCLWNARHNYVQQCVQQYRTFRDRAPYKKIERLSDKDIADITKYSTPADYVSRVCDDDLYIQDKIFEMPDSKLYFKQKGAKFLYECIKQNEGDIKTVLNIGARIDSGLYFLAKKFPHITFVSLDFQTSLKEQNEEAFPEIPPNWKFLSGYALDMLEEGLRADLVYTQATTVVFGSKEVDNYFKLFRENGVKYVALQESWYPRTGGWKFWKVQRPEDIDIDCPSSSGSIGNFHHNFVGKFEREQFDVKSSVIRDDHECGEYYVYQVLAKNTNSTTGQRLAA